MPWGGWLEYGSYLSSLLANTLKSNQVEVGGGGRSGGVPVARLKEPKDPCALPREPDCQIEAPRWPIECQVVEGRILHIESMPACPEAYYEPTGREVQPKPIGDDHGTTLFQYHPMSAVTYNSDDELAPKIISLPKRVHDFSRSTTRRTSGENNPCCHGDSLMFESRFESGNLAKAVKITDTYYELSLRTDLYTNRHVQWFYFMVENTKRGLTYRFSIVNFSKGESLYSEGMKPVMYSTRDAVLNKLGWRRFGTNISYFKNEPANGEDDNNCSYTLSFNAEFPHDDDCVYIAHSYPYTYTDLQDYLLRLQNNPVKSIYTKLRLLCKTLAGNNVYYLTVTEPPNPEDPPKKKKAVVVTARVHPGETPASWMMKGLIDYITSDTSQAKELREKFIFKLIPMLNPDGVIVGNNRCSLTGRDLNRQYRTVIRETYPPVWHTKLMIKRLLEECGVAMYCDLHAHSRKHNVFIYGCENKRLPDKRLQEQVFPLMLHKNTADKFSFESCKFRIQRSKEGTGRVVVWMMGVANSYTMEASFAGSTLGRRSGTHFTTFDYESIGRSFCETLLDFVDDTPSKEKLRLKIMTKLQKGGSNADEPANINISDYTSDEGDSDESSGDEDGPRRKQLTVPPCSPASPSPPLPRIREAVSAKLTRQLPVIISSPQQRKTIPIGKAVLEVEWSDGEEGGSDSEKDGELVSSKTGASPAKFSASPLIYGASPVRYRKLDAIPPPQLIVTSAKQASERRRFPERSKSADFTRGIINEVEKPRIYRSPGRVVEVEARSTASLQTLLIGATDFSITWAHFSKQQDKILRSCSKKLAQFVRRQKNKKEKKTKADKDEEKMTFRKKVKLKATRSRKVDQSSSSDAKDGKNDSLKIKSIKSTDSSEKSSTEKKKMQQATKTFRKGGIVATATVNSKKLKGNDIPELPLLKKKKKKKKLVQLQSKVKSVFAVVSSNTAKK